MSEVSAVIFDVYETLAHNHPSLWLPTFEEICRDQHLPLGGQDLWDLWKPLELRFREARGQPDSTGNIPPFKTYEEAWRDCFHQVFSQLHKGDAADAARRCVIALGQRELFPETAQVMTRLRSTDSLRLGVVSNADNDSLWPLLRRHRLEFNGVVTSESARAYKPHPRPFQLIVEALGGPAQECLFVGDQQYDDIQGARAAGMRTVLVKRQGARLDPHRAIPDYQVGDLREVLEILEVARGDPRKAASRE